MSRPPIQVPVDPPPGSLSERVESSGASATVTGKLYVEIDTKPVRDFLCQLRADISALERIPEFPLDCLLQLGERALSDSSSDFLTSSPVNCRDQLVVRLGEGSNLHLFAAAVSALKTYAIRSQHTAEEG